MGSSLRRTLHLFIIGAMLARMHFVSYIMAIVNSVLWLLIIFVPAVLLTGKPVDAFRTFIPGVLALSVGGVGMWAATEFLRWYVYEGLTDLFRENGLGVVHYLLAGAPIEALTHGVPTFLLAGIGVCAYLKLPLDVIVPTNPLALVAAVLASIPVYMVCGSIIAYFYTTTRISDAWTNLIQMLLALGTIVPPSIGGPPELYLANPATLVAELARAAYNANIIPSWELVVLTPVLSIVWLIVALLVGRLCDTYIARHGIEYRI